jgi:hypothetical protein
MTQDWNRLMNQGLYRINKSGILWVMFFWINLWLIVKQSCYLNSRLGGAADLTINRHSNLVLLNTEKLSVVRTYRALH